MSSTRQPEWRLAGRIGDVDPIAHGGGFVYEDATGVYAPEIAWFEHAPDEQWHRDGGATPVTVYRIVVERDSEAEWWHERLADVAASAGLDPESLREQAGETDTMTRARLYSDLISYFGPYEFDQYPVTMTEDEAYAKYAAELKGAR